MTAGRWRWTVVTALAGWLAGGCELIYGDPQAGDLGVGNLDLSGPPGPDLASSDLACDVANVASDVFNCGACGNDCTRLPGVEPSRVACTAGVCDVLGACLDGLAQCPGDHGCQTRIGVAAHCGTCTTTCGGGTPRCSRDGVSLQFRCVAACDGLTPTTCGGDCADTMTDPYHCGATCAACTGAFCVMGQCVDCADGQRRCGGTCQFESAAACGAACQVCPVPDHGYALCLQSGCAIGCEVGAVPQGNTCVLTWQEEKTTLPGSARFLGVWGSAATDVYAVGEQGIIVHSTGDGTWTAQTSGTADDLFAIWGSSATDVYVAGRALPGGAMVLLHSSGGGAWTTVASPAAAPYATALWGTSASDVYVIDQGILYRNTGGGWMAQAGISPWYIGGSGASDVYAVSPSNIWHYNGAMWTEEGLSFSHNFPSLDFVWASGPGDVWTGGVKYVYHSTGSDNWVQQSINADVLAMWGSGPTDVYAGGAFDNVLSHSTGDGTWTPVDIPALTEVLAIWGTGPGNVFVVGQSGIVHKVH